MEVGVLKEGYPSSPYHVWLKLSLLPQVKEMAKPMNDPPNSTAPTTSACEMWKLGELNDIQTPCFFVFCFFLTTIFLLAICFKYYCSATSKKLTWHKIDLSIFSHFPDIGSWLDLLYCAKSNALILGGRRASKFYGHAMFQLEFWLEILAVQIQIFNPLQRPLKATWWYILTIQWNDENCYPLPLLLISRDVPLNSIICWSLTLKALTGALKRSLTRYNNWHNTSFKENDYFNLINWWTKSKKNSENNGQMDPEIQSVPNIVITF